MKPNSDTENITPGQGKPAEANQNQTPNGVGAPDKAAQEAELDKRIAEKSTQVSQLEKVATDLTIRVRGLRGQTKDSDLFEPAAPKPKVDSDEEPDEVNQKITDALIRNKQDERIRLYNSVAKQFMSEREEFDPGNDLTGELQEEFKSIARNTFLGENESQVRNRLTVILNGLVATKNSAKKSGDRDIITDIGDTTTTTKPKPKEKNIWLTKKLNKYEQEAADRYPGGEASYRQKQAEMEDKRPKA